MKLSLEVLYNIKNIICDKPHMGFIFRHFSVYMPVPLFLLIYITTNCNRKCEWCYQRKDIFFAEHPGDMPVEDFEKILFFSSRPRFFRPHIHLFGGEPLTHPRFTEIVSLCKKYRFYPSITTNGDYISRYSGIIRQSTISQVNISLGDTPPGECVNGLSHALLLDKLISCGKIININCPITGNNYSRLEDIVSSIGQRFDKKEIGLFVFQHYMSGDVDQQPYKTDFDIGTLARQIESIKRRKFPFKVKFMPDIKPADLYLYYFTNYQFKNNCYVPWFGFSIYPDLTAVPGNGALFCNNIIGNLATDSLRGIWRGEKIINFRKKLWSDGLDGLCNRCCQKFYY